MKWASDFQRIAWVGGQLKKKKCYSKYYEWYDIEWLTWMFVYYSSVHVTRGSEVNKLSLFIHYTFLSKALSATWMIYILIQLFIEFLIMKSYSATDIIAQYLMHERPQNKIQERSRFYSKRQMAYVLCSHNYLF